MPYLLGFAMIPLKTVLLYSFVMFDRLVRLEHERHRAHWEADGRPCGSLWHPAEANRLGSALACARLSFIWLFRAPRWVSESPDLVAIWRRHRMAILGWNVGLVIWFALYLAFLGGLYG